MEVPLLKRRLSTPRAATVVVLAAVVAVSVTVVPSIAQSVLTPQRAAKTYVSNKKASTLYLRKKAASNLYVAKATNPKPPVASIAASNTVFGPTAQTTAGYIPTAYTSFGLPAKVSTAVITFSGTATCTSEKPTQEQACPVQIEIDGQKPQTVNFAPATAATKAVPLVHTITQATVLAKGGHTVAIKYAGAKNVTFTLNTWNLAVEAFPQPEESIAPTSSSGSSGSTGSTGSTGSSSKSS